MMSVRTKTRTIRRKMMKASNLTSEQLLVSRLACSTIFNNALTGREIVYLIVLVFVQRKLNIRGQKWNFSQ